MIIEGEELEITSQKIMPKIQLPEARYTLKGEKVVVYPFSLSIHGDGTINKENSIKDDKGNTVARYDLDARLVKGTCVDGIKLWGFGKKRLDPISVGGGNARTGAHPCQATKVRGLCYLKMFQSYLGITDLIHPQTLYKAPPQIER
jgi:hypothetical protein